MRRILSLIVAATVLLGIAGCGSGDREQLRVAAAASLNGAFEEIVRAFERTHEGIDVAPVVYDGSSTLATQIAEGAPVDVAAFADEHTMGTIADRMHAPRIFATNSLVIAVPAGSTSVSSLDDLADPSLDVVVCAPAVPCGAATSVALREAGVAVDAASFEQNVTAVARKVANGVADAGVVYLTDALADDAIDQVIDPRLERVTNAYPIGSAADSGAAADAFVDYVLSDEGQRILARWGFVTP